jgi:L-aspartate oxidase
MVPSLENPSTRPPTEPLDLADIRNSLKSLMWRNCGVRRDGDGLREAAENVDHWCRYALARQFSDPHGWELQNMLCLARLMIGAALRREETRGSHFRTDFPQRDDEHWNRHQVFNRRQEGAEGVRELTR